ncbi:iron-siderophore ABC transporter substrate-binding protein [Phycicoccus endophyticus]|uniref:Iron-siderophore ABC transporter substrate-binding protein n=1 Tax=Phycicoccus endophyticus TaxID=1690220 RepID=A0A7G9R1B1_9MICO|nr:iron-siderophore ABC transporter substrate-binding protein [Phycicoccus endophyticus]NHI18837.1 iron-siderophore ABC transporter substrate-binding protein [Phycicoccus endophyticus]QNN49386.1 iron-siderophore ABC transporter substrate-binding protein [Phycicoccus endophyticus]GGL36143.1 Fe3+-hydroxamate ABC transporter substrate-binding protein [Phycicoccus endophyticus]
MPSRRRLLAAAPLLAAALAVSACSTGPSGGEEAQSSASTTAPADAFPVSVEHTYGTTTIEAAPTRVATVGWADADTLAALGIVPVGAPKITWGGNEAGSTDWFDEQLASIGADPSDVTRYDDSAGIPFDKIAATAPDLILGLSSGISEEDYDKLTKIAPTVAWTEKAWGTPWQEQVRTIGEAVGRSQDAEQLVTDTEQTISDAVAAHPEIEGKTAAWAWFTTTDLSTVGLYTTSDLRPQMLTELGFEPSPTVVELSAKDPSAFTTNLSAEKASSLQADIIVFYAQDESTAQALKKNDLIGQIPALADGHYVASTDNAVALSMSLPSPLSMRTAVEEFLPKLVSAVNGTPAS